MNPIADILKQYPFLVLDGAFATELERRGCDLNDPLWSAKVLMENPQLIAELHFDYLDAGADCIITASYQASFEGFGRRGLTDEEAQELISQSVILACKARDAFWQKSSNRVNRLKPLVAASVGPYGAYLADGSEYRGDYDLDVEGLVEFHRRRFDVLVQAGPDILACETIPCLQEAEALVKLLEEHPGQSCWVSFSGRDETTISNGESIRDCARFLNDYAQVAAIGLNCTPPEYISSLIAEIRQETDKPIIVYPNSGERYDGTNKRWITGSVTEPFAEMAKRWFADGAWLIGGCCRTTPEDIRAIANWRNSIS